LHELDDKVVSLKNSTYGTHKLNKNLVYCDQEAEFNEVSIQGKNTLWKEHYYKYGYRKDVGLKVRHIQYVRYVNDFLIGIVGSREYARQIRKDLNNFIKSNLHLDVKKDNLVSCNDGPVKFLGHFLRLRGFKVKASVVPKSIRAAMKNKNKSISRFLKSDKRLGRAKSNQFYSNVLKQFDVLSRKLKISITNKPCVEVLARIIAYKGLGSHILKTLSLDNWEQFNKLLSAIDSHKLFVEKRNNSALTRWSSYLQIESDKLSEFSTQILQDKIVSQAASD
jgi:hypothetical protein